MPGTGHDRRVSRRVDGAGRPDDGAAGIGLDDDAQVHVPVHEDAGDGGVQQDAHAGVSEQ